MEDCEEGGESEVENRLEKQKSNKKQKKAKETKENNKNPWLCCMLFEHSYIVISQVPV